MILIHILEDFHLQGIMANMKQKVWWINQPGYSRKYRWDFVPPLILHGFEWAVLVSLPLFLLESAPEWYIAVVICMGLIHSGIDHMKCNRLEINLVQDQILHLAQILLLWGIWVCFC